MTSYSLYYWKNRRTMQSCASLFSLALVCGLLALAGGLLQLAPLVPAVGLVVRGTRCWSDKFDRAQSFTTTPGMNGWTIKDTSSAGTPTYLCMTEDGGAAALTLDATSEAQVVTLYQNDVLMFDVRMIQHFRAIVQVSGIDAVTTLVVGLGAAQNDTADSVATNAWFRMQGSVSTTALVVETDDATTDNDDKASGQTLAAVYKLLHIDFTRGLTDVRFFIDGERVAEGTTFDMSALSAGLNVQPFVQLQKASGTGTPAVKIALMEVDYKYALGA
ncbi:MAG: hypothetical protein A3E01_10805 [Gammaproteobacteria bacterium RIFCSPHIGHO2_12_FULL_63_22]|nr:MAG: hypothetical protein A3E01_10805 [Gammaproteobacteria bacterium RIFCSPHIGHO2_12_FULL_63_22]